MKSQLFILHAINAFGYGLCTGIPFLSGRQDRLFEMQILGLIVLICISQYINFKVILLIDGISDYAAGSAGKVCFCRYFFLLLIFFQILLVILALLKGKYYLVLPLASLIVVLTQLLSQITFYEHKSSVKITNFVQKESL